jgi:hypothetical protein
MEAAGPPERFLHIHIHTKSHNNPEDQTLVNSFITLRNPKLIRYVKGLVLILTSIYM